MAKLVVSSLAVRDIEAILDESAARHGPNSSIRYEGLIRQAMIDLAANPQRAGAHARADIIAVAGTYHIKHSRSNIPASPRVKRPCHFLLFQMLDAATVEVSRVLHDGMDIVQHLPADYPSESEDDVSSLLRSEQP